jgi:hypothetical protein
LGGVVTVASAVQSIRREGMGERERGKGRGKELCCRLARRCDRACAITASESTPCSGCVTGCLGLRRCGTT